MPERLTAHRICEKRVEGEILWTAWERGARERRLKWREGRGEGEVMVTVEWRRLESKKVTVEWRAERAVIVRVRV